MAPEKLSHLLGVPSILSHPGVIEQKNEDLVKQHTLLKSYSRFHWKNYIYTKRKFACPESTHSLLFSGVSKIRIWGTSDTTQAPEAKDAPVWCHPPRPHRPQWRPKSLAPAGLMRHQRWPGRCRRRHIQQWRSHCPHLELHFGAGDSYPSQMCCPTTLSFVFCWRKKRTMKNHHWRGRFFLIHLFQPLILSQSNVLES